MPEKEKITRQFPELSGFDFPQYCQTIREEFDQLPQDSSATRILRLHSEKYISEINIGDLNPQDGCFQISMLLGYAKIFHQKIAGLSHFSQNGMYLNNDLGWEKENEGEEIIKGYEQGQKRFESDLGWDMKLFGIGPIALYFEKKLGSKVNTIQEDVDFVLKGPIAVVPFDHFTAARDFIGRECHYPESFDRAVFKYLKAEGFPPLVFYSDREENNFYSFAEFIRKEQGFKNVREAIAETGSHELAHYRLIDFAIEIIKSGPAHSWLTEGVAQYYGEESWPKTKIMKIPQDEILNVLDIVDPVDGGVNYEKSLLLLLALGVKKAQTEKLIYRDDPIDTVVAKGVKQIIYELSAYTLNVVNGKSPKLKSAKELLYMIDPELKQQDKLEFFRNYLEGVWGYFRLKGQGIDPGVRV